MSTREQFILRAETFLRHSGMSERQFGIEAVGDHKFFKRLREGAGVTLTVIEKAERFIAERAAFPLASASPAVTPEQAAD